MILLGIRVICTFNDSAHLKGLIVPYLPFRIAESHRFGELRDTYIKPCGCD